MKSKFLHICLGVSVVLFSVGFLIRSISPAQAAPLPEQFQDAGTNKIGKYMMMISPETEKYNESIYVWDTETGASVRYQSRGGIYDKSSSLPANPFGQ